MQQVGCKPCILYDGARLSFSEYSLWRDPQGNEVALHGRRIVKVGLFVCDTATKDDLGLGIMRSKIDHHGHRFGVVLKHYRADVRVSYFVIGARREQ